VIRKQDTYFVRHHSDSPYKYSEADIKRILDFVVDNIFIAFGDQVFQKYPGIPIGMNSDPLLANLFLYSYEAGRNCYMIIKNGNVFQPYIQIHQ
jgi:hypothetical protein